MSQIDTDFTIVHTFATHPGILVRRARRNSDGIAVILKRTAPQQADEDSVARLSYEHAMLTHLHAHRPDPRIIAPLQMWGSVAETTLVLEDIGGSSLHDLARQQPFPLEKILELGQQVAEVLSLVHAAGVLHKDVNPRNIIYNRQSGALQLIDFGIAVRLDREVKAADGQHAADGTLAYAPPEQVGRMARYADHRSDYYSLGATLYALLCGRPPFVEDTENKLMHSILTATPVPPHVHDPRIPEAVSQVVMRLLDKMQERRYRSARGIAFDLGQCREHLAGRRAVVELGQEDRSDRFELPDKLYGRRDELLALHHAFREATGRRTALVFLGGPSGIGKSSLVNELQAELVGFDALFASGKHDQLRRHMPFSALSQAITGLVRGFLFEPEAQLNYWRRSIQAALGQVGQALIEVVPAIELLLGPQPPVTPLPTRETENRLHYLLQRLINALAADRPMLLFLDDLQWADHGTIKLLHALLYSNDAVAGLCIVAAYRDNEVPADHPLAQLLLDLQASERPFTQILLEPLAVSATQALLQDATGAPPETVHALAPVVHAKTHGNPFFARAYLQHLNREGLLRFDAETRYFKWDLATIQSTSVTDNVVNLLTEKLRLLSAATQRILSTAACLGNQFHMRDLEAVTAAERERVVQAVNDALADGLIVPLSGNYRFAEHTHADNVFKFAHDRIQQAVFELMPADATQQVQRTIGLYLWERSRAEPTHGSIFDTLGHLNAARVLFQDEKERTDLAQLNLTGAREAKRAGALAIALTYLQHAAALLGDEAWERVPQLKRGVEMGLADNEFLSGNIDAASSRLVKVVERSNDPVDRTEIEIRRVTALIAAGQLEGALEAGVRGLHALGMKLPLHPKRWHQGVALGRLLIALIPHKIADLPRLPAAQDPRHVAIIALLNSMKMGAFYASPMMFALLALVAPLTTVRYGTSRDSSSSLGLVALVLVQLNMYRTAKVFAELAREGTRVRPDSLDKGSIEFSAAAFVEFIDLRPDAFLEQMRRSYFIGLEAGDPLFGGWAGLCGPLSFVWVSFSRSERELHAFEGYIRQRNEAHQMITLRTQLKFMQLLRGEIDLATYKADAPRAEADALRGTGAAHWVCLRVAACWLLGDVDGAWEAVQDGRAWRVHENMGEFMMPFLALYATLTFCARRARGARFTLGESGYYLQMRIKLRAFATEGRVNYEGVNTLAQAMDLSARNRLRTAEPLFDRAITALSRSDYTILRATAMECGGRYFAHMGRPMAARGYLDGAVEAYRVLGAELKSQALEQEFSLARNLRRDAATATQTATRTLVGTAGTGTGATRTRGTKSNTGTGAADQLEKDLDINVARRLGAAALQDVNHQTLGSTCIAALVELSAATRAVISLGQPGTPSHALYDSAVPGALVPEQILAFTWRTREMVFNNNVKEADTKNDAYLAALRPQCYCSLPMLSRGRSTGVVYLENTVAPDVFTSARLASLTHATVSITLAFELHQHRHQLTQLAATQANALRDAADRVVQRERESTETQLAGGFAHEMRNALTAAAYPLEMLAPSPKDEEVTNMSLYTTYSELLTALGPNALSPDQLQMFQDTNEVLRNIAQEVNRGVNRALVLTQDILEYAQASRILPGNHRVRIKDVCQSVLEEHRPSFEANGIVSVVDIPDSLYASVSEPHAYAIARNLISNARDAVCMGDAQRQRRIEVHAFNTAEMLHLRVQDSGVGMSAAQAGRVFQPFFTTKGSRGTGLGLGFARKVLTAYGGKIDFSSTEGVGTTFDVEMPASPTEKA